MAKAISAPFKKGVNFTIWLEYGSVEQNHADMFTKKDFENAKSLGCDVIRIPIHFEKFCSEADGYQIPKFLLDVLDNVAAWTEELGMYAIFDFHNRTDVDSFTATDVERILNPVWTQLAKRYRDRSDYLIYELMNEPHGIEIPVWNGIIERLHKLVRSIDDKHYIIVGGADWNSFTGMRALPEFRDDKVIYTFHFYDPHTFTHQGAPWCHMERVRGIPFPYDPDRMPPMPENPTDVERKCFEEYPAKGTLEEVEKFFDEYVSFSLERKAPIYCGEFGCSAACVDPAERVRWYEIVTNLLEERGISRSNWDYYGGFGIFNVKPGKMFAKPAFPEDLNLELLKAMGLTIPTGK